MPRVALLFLCVLAGCVGQDLVECGQLLCPSGNVCTAGGCATPAAAAACDGKANGDDCMTVAIVAGACVEGACFATVCGDGRVDPHERCDDGNVTDADGCSATCDSDETCGNGVIDLVNGEQ